MKIKPLVYFSIAVALLFASCKKSDNPGRFPDLNGVYQASNTEELSALVMYTVNGKVTNQDTISAYFTRHTNSIFSSIFFLGVNSITNDNTGFEANFESDGTVALSNSKQNTAPAIYSITDKSSTGFILEAADTGRTFEGETGIIPSRSSIILPEINTLNRVTNCRPIPPVGSGYSEMCTFRDAKQLVIKNNQIYFAFISYSISNSSKYGYSYAAIGNDSGSFNTGVVSQLSSGDTLIYQNKFVLLTKMQ